MQKIITNREKIILYLTIGVIIFGIGFTFLLTPILNEYAKLDKEINITRARFRKYQLLLSQKEYIQKKYDQFASGANLSGTGKDSLVNVLTELEDLAKEADIRIIDIRPQGPAGAATLYKEVVVDLRTEGAIEGYLKFIYRIENSLSLLRIKRFQLAARPNSPALEGVFSISQVSLE